MSIGKIIPLALMVGTLSGAAFAQDAMRSVDGTVSYMQRIALPPEAEVVVEARGLRDVLLGEARFTADGAQVPLPFTFDMPAGPGAAVRASIALEGQTRWLGDVVALPPGTDNTTLPDMLLTAYPTGAIPTPMICGDTPILMSFDGEATIIEALGQTLRMMPVEAASGAKFEVPGDGTTFFWSKGDNGLLSLFGTEYPECVPAPAPEPAVYRARGNEPGWSLTVTGDAFDFTTMDGEPVTGIVPQAVWQDGAVIWNIADAGLTVRMTDTLCHDAMSGMPFPETVSVGTADQTFAGCGGDPASLLAGGEWVVEDIGGAGIIDDAHVTLEFGMDGSVSGAGGCNRYSGGYTLTGEGLTFLPAASTMMACPEAVMNLEASFHQALAKVARFDIAETGALMLLDAEGTAQITAFRN